MNINPVSSLIATLPAQNVSPLTPPTVANAIASAQTSDASSISPAATLLNQLSQLQQQNPARFSQVLTQITTRLQQAAQNASNNGNITQAAQLNQLAASFQNASASGQLPTVQQLQQAGLTGHHHHGGGHHPAPATDPTTSTQAI
jgi:hypothetical protein